MNDLITEKMKEIAVKHAKIIEKECKEACKRFNVLPEELIIEYAVTRNIKISIKYCELKITDAFTCDGKTIYTSNSEN